MKKYLFLALVVLLLASCTQNRYTITGELKGNALPTKVYLKLLMGEDEPKTIDSVDVKDGKFVIKGTVESPEFAVLQLTNDIYFPIILEKGEVKLEADLDKVADFKLSGTAGNQKFVEFRNSDKAFRFKMDSIYQKYVNAQVAGKLTADLEKSIKDSYDVVNQSRTLFVEKFIKNNTGSIASAAILSQEKYGLAPEKFEELFNTLSKDLAECHIVKSMQKDVSILKATAVGQPFLDFKLPNVNGKEVAFSSIAANSKLVLLDFWASWCGPCRAENPHVVKIYEKYKSNGLQIVGVSLDENKSKWMEAIQKDAITWIQLSDLKGWKSSAAAIYGVKAIPATYLINGGKIVARDLRGDALDAKIAEILGISGSK